LPVPKTPPRVPASPVTSSKAPPSGAGPVPVHQKTCPSGLRAKAAAIRTHIAAEATNSSLHPGTSVVQIGTVSVLCRTEAVPPHPIHTQTSSAKRNFSVDKRPLWELMELVRGSPCNGRLPPKPRSHGGVFFAGAVGVYVAPPPAAKIAAFISVSARSRRRHRAVCRRPEIDSSQNAT
jgi:hypothetical protein